MSAVQWGDHAKDAAEQVVDERLQAACDWSDYRKDYGVSSDPEVMGREHRAFLAGWQAGRHGDQSRRPVRLDGGRLVSELYHYTCADHGAPGIDREGVIRPGSDLGVTLPQAMFAWFTDLDVPLREALGLTDRIAKCDRTARRYTVDSPKVMPWMGVRRALPRYFVDMLEGTPGAMPRHWWVAAEPIEVAS